MSKLASMSRAELRAVIRDQAEEIAELRFRLAEIVRANSPEALNQRLQEFVQRPAVSNGIAEALTRIAERDSTRTTELAGSAIG